MPQGPCHRYQMHWPSTHPHSAPWRCGQSRASQVVTSRSALHTSLEQPLRMQSASLEHMLLAPMPSTRRYSGESGDTNALRPERAPVPPSADDRGGMESDPSLLLQATLASTSNTPPTYPTTFCFALPT